MGVVALSGPASPRSGGRPAVLLDRDGVLNRAFLREGTTCPPRDLSELELLPGVTEAVARLSRAGLVLVGVTNQPDVARGRQTRAVVEQLNARLVGSLGLLEVLSCFHDDADACTCRKPRPGLLFEAARRHGLDLARSAMVGDRWSDVQAGQAAGCRTLLIETPHSGSERCTPDARAADLLSAVPTLLAWLAC